MGLSLPWSLLLLGLLTGPGASGEDSAPVVVTGTLGGSVILPLQLQDEQQVESILWMCHSVPRAIATITLVEAGGPDAFSQAETPYWGRLSVVGPGRSLQISGLTWEDAGPYRAHVNLRNSRITHTWEYSLHIYGECPGDGDSCSCCRPKPSWFWPRVAESRGGTVTYSWTPLGPRTVVSHGGSVLSVSLRPGDGALNFTCVVKNPVSNSTSLPVSVPPSCTGPGVLGGDMISPLGPQDSGPYRAWMTLHTPPINITKDFTLRIYERLQEPTITVSSQIMKDGTCFITLACSLDQAGEDVQYSWDPRGQGAVVSHGGTTLSVSRRSGVSDSYRCTAKNPVSQSSSSIPTSSLCSGNDFLL
ncbi:SLAM family member 9 [Camelus ferus]|nr:SLAM family member 9 [Camelus ferus]